MKGGAAALALAILAFACRPSAASEAITIGLQKFGGLGPVFIAQERGYFAAEGLNAQLVYFTAAQPIAVGVVSGDLDFGVAGFGAGFYNLAAQGALRIVGAYVREAPSFRATDYVVSNKAYEAGLTSLKDFAGHSVAVMQIGSSQHYALGLLAEKYHLDLATMRVLAVQSGPNEASAVSGGQVDAAVVPDAYIRPSLDRGDAKLLGYVGDETPWQLGGVFTATGTADRRHDIVAHFLAAYRQGVRDYHDAFIDENEQRRDGPTAPAILAIISKYTGESTEALEAGIAYFDPQARLDVADVLHQIAWYKAQNLLKGEIDGTVLVDGRYVVPLDKHTPR